MPDQFAGLTMDVGPFKVVELSARGTENLRSDHHRNVEALAVEKTLLAPRSTSR
jgi:hypothetical protein